MATLIDIIQKMVESEYATGPDMSRWQDGVNFDAADLKFIAPALDFVMYKLGFGGTDGVCYEDPKASETAAELEEHPEIFRIGYWYMSSHVPWQQQFAFFCALIDKYGIDMVSVDGEKIYNVRSQRFARDTMLMMDALIERYPDKMVDMYSNFYIYRDWFRAFYPKFDSYYYHQAQYPYAAWTNITASFMNFWAGVFAGFGFKPTVPPSRKGRWLLWQFVDRSGLGKYFGVGSPNLDFNISKLKREEFFDLVGRPERWFDVETGETTVTPGEMVVVIPGEPVSSPVEIPYTGENVPTVEVGSVGVDGKTLSITLNIGGIL